MPRRFDHLSDVEVLLNVVEHGSLTAAAVVLATTPSVLSRAVARLEQRLGTQLLRRTTRSMSLTETGREYVDEARAAFALLDKAEHAIQGSAQQLTGRVRLSAPTSYGHQRLPAMLAAFARAYPLVQVEVNITNRNVDLAAEGFDLAIRSGALPDSSMVAHRLENAPVVLSASPGYVRDAGPLETFEDLQRQRCIAFLRPSTGRAVTWPLRVNGEEIDWTPPASITVSDDVMGVVSLAEQGLGITMCPQFMISRSVETGRLVEVLPQLPCRPRPFSVVFAPHRNLSPAARALIDTLVAATR